MAIDFDNITEDLEYLKKGGLSEIDIAGLFQFKRTRAPCLIEETQRNNINLQTLRRLEFYRWLYLAGRLNEGVETNES